MKRINKQEREEEKTKEGGERDTWKEDRNKEKETGASEWNGEKKAEQDERVGERGRGRERERGRTGYRMNAKMRQGKSAGDIRKRRREDKQKEKVSSRGKETTIKQE